MDTVCCNECLNFSPDTIGDGMGIGKCKAFEVYRTKNPSESALRLALIKLGNRPDDRLFWGGSPGFMDRVCEKYAPI